MTRNTSDTTLHAMRCALRSTKSTSGAWKKTQANLLTIHYSTTRTKTSKFWPSKIMEEAYLQGFITLLKTHVLRSKDLLARDLKSARLESTLHLLQEQVLFALLTWSLPWSWQLSISHPHKLMGKWRRRTRTWWLEMSQSIKETPGRVCLKVRLSFISMCLSQSALRQ